MEKSGMTKQSNNPSRDVTIGKGRLESVPECWVGSRKGWQFSILDYNYLTRRKRIEKILTSPTHFLHSSPPSFSFHVITFTFSNTHSSYLYNMYNQTQSGYI
uniref:Uncharacterized protein n=1 Tax=Cacopsylla melanoneura TaxID=428564 RepID=A0A8D8PP33_9HEMI